MKLKMIFKKFNIVLLALTLLTSIIVVNNKEVKTKAIQNPSFNYTTKDVGNFKTPEVYTVGIPLTPQGWSIKYTKKELYKAYLLLINNWSDTTQTITTRYNGIQINLNARPDVQRLKSGSALAPFQATFISDLYDVTDFLNAQNTGEFTFTTTTVNAIEHSQATLVLLPKSTDEVIKYNEIRWLQTPFQNSSTNDFSYVYDTILPENAKDIYMYGAYGAFDNTFERVNTNIKVNDGLKYNINYEGVSTTTASYSDCSGLVKCSDGNTPIKSAPWSKLWSRDVVNNGEVNKIEISGNTNTSTAAWETYTGIYFEAGNVNNFAQTTSVPTFKENQTINYIFEIDGTNVESGTNNVTLTSPFNDTEFTGAVIGTPSISDGTINNGAIKTGLNITVPLATKVYVTVPVTMPSSFVSTDNSLDNNATLVTAINGTLPAYTLSSATKLLPNPNDLTVNSVYVGQSVVTGTTSPGSTVQLFDANNNPLGEPVIADANGEYAFNIDPSVTLTQGQQLTAKSTDGSGNVVTTPITVQTLNPLVINSVNTDATSISGSGAVAGSTVLVTIKDKDGNIISENQEATVNGDGSWTLTGLDPLPSGAVIEAVQTYNGASSEPAQVVVNGDALPQVNPVQPGDTTITGTGTPNATINITDEDGNLVGTTTVGPDGSWSVPLNPAAASGDNYSVTSNDGVGDASDPINVIVGATNPPTVNAVNSTDSELVGTGVPNATITVTLPDGSTQTTIVEADGSWSIPVTGLEVSDQITVTQGDQTGVSAPVNVTVGVIETPTIDPVSSTDLVITGTGTPNSWVRLTTPNNRGVWVQVKEDGTWSAPLPRGVILDYGQKVFAAASDRKGGTILTDTVFAIVDLELLPPIVRPISANDTTITGQGEPGAIIDVELPDGQIVTTTVEADGTWSIDVPAGVTLETGEKVKVTQKDDTQTVSVTAVVDGTTKPTIDQGYVGATQVTGTGVPNAEITVIDQNGLEQTTVVDENGNWTLSLEEPLQSGDTIVAFQGDGAGNYSESVQMAVTSELSAPSISPVNANDQVVSGTNAIPKSEITVTFPNGETATAIVDENGNWSVDVPSTVTLENGDSIEASASLNGAVSQSSSVIVGATSMPTIDQGYVGANQVSGTGVPNATITILDEMGNTIGTTTVDENGNYVANLNKTLAANETVSAIQSDGQNSSDPAEMTVTSELSVPTVNPINTGDTTISGSNATPGANVVVTMPDGSKEIVVADENGNWSLDIPGDVTIESGQEIKVSSELNGATSPEQTIVVDGTQSPTVEAVNSGDTSVSGTGVPNATIVITDKDGNTVGTTTVGPDGNWTATIDPAAVSGEQLTVISTDGGQNNSEGVNVVVDGTVKPTVNPVNPGDTSVSGTGVPNATIEITNEDGQVIGTTTVGPDGNWTATIDPAAVSGDTIDVTSSDLAGNKSEVEQIIVGGTQTPTINPIDATDTQVSGTAGPNAQVTVSLPGGESVTTTADENGNWTIDKPSDVELENGDLITAVASDGANVSSPTATIVGVTNDPTVNPIFDQDTQISGTGIAGSQIIVNDANGNLLGTTTVDENGTWSIEPITRPLEKGEVVQITQNDGENESYPVQIVVDGTMAPTIDPVNPLAPTVSGTGVPNADIIVTMIDDNGNPVQVTTKVDAEGNWTVDVPSGTTLNTGDKVQASSFDGQNPPQTASVVVVGASSTPTIDQGYIGATQVSGTGVPNGIITVTVPNENGTTTQITTIVDAMGNWKVDLPAALKDEDKVTAVQSDGQNSSEPAQMIVTEQLQKPTVNAVNPKDSTISGTATPGANVVVTMPDGTKVVVVADENGNWTAEVPATIELELGDVVKVESNLNGATTNEVEVIVGASSTPTIDQGYIGATQVSGTGVPNGIITVTVPNENGTTTQITTIVDAMGNWKVDLPVALKDEDKVTAVQSDGQNSSEPAQMIVTEQLQTPTVNAVNPKDSTISGTATPGANVVVTMPDGTKVVVVADENGNWTAEVPATIELELGDVVKVESNLNGATTNEVEVIVGGTLPPQINQAYAGQTSVSGKGTPGARVFLSLEGDDQVYEADVDADGNWSIEIGYELKPEQIITAVQSDGTSEVETQSEPAEVETANVPSPEVNEINPGDKVVSGTGIAGSTVTVTFPDGTTVETVVDANGNWQVTIPDGVVLKDGDKVQAVASFGSYPSNEAEVSYIEPTEPLEESYEETGRRSEINSLLALIGFIILGMLIRKTKQ